MQQKLKAVFRSSSKTHAHPEQTDPTSPRSTHDNRQATSLDEHRRRRSSDSHNGGAQHNGRSRPLSSVYDSRRPNNHASGSHPVALDYAQPRTSEPANESIASDYKAYMPVLSAVDDSYDGQHMSLGGDRRLITGESDGRHEEDVADRNIDRYRTSLDVSKRKPLPATPGMCIDQSTVLPEAATAMLMKNYVNGFAALDVADQDLPRKFSTRDGSLGSTFGSDPSAATGRYSVGRDAPTKNGLTDSNLPHPEATAHEKNQSKKSELPSRSARGETRVGWSIRKPRDSESEDEVPRSLPNGPRSPDGALAEPRTAATGQHEIEKEIEQLLDGVVDLRNTVDEDKDVRWAPTVVHEVVKPHEHEIIQHKVLREIHNYEYYHHIQPVYDIEVLPPRHWIPNPDGGGLVEISADEIPSRTGNNRRWKVVHEQMEPSAVSGRPWRTDREIIEHPTSTTDEGFERRETTIVYPPTLQDMTEYDGLVQPVHFDHKTGERWLGEITTMHKLRQSLGQVADPALSLKELGEALPEVPEVSQMPDLSQSPEVKRKPVHGEAPARSEHMGIAV